MRPYDEVNKLADPQSTAGGLIQETAPSNSLLSRLHQRRRQLENELRRVCNSIEFVEKNAALVEIVEVVLASREKCDPRPLL